MFFGGVVVDGAGQRGLEAGQVHAALVVVDVVAEAEDHLVVGVVVLQRHLDLDLRRCSPCEVDGLVVEHRLVLVQVLDELADAAVVLELVALAGALVGDGDAQAGVEERELRAAAGESTSKL